MADRSGKFTERARRVLILAQEEARGLNHNYIGTEHLLLGLVREREGVGAKVLGNLGVELSKVRSAAESIIGRGDRPVTDELGLTPRAKKVIELGVDEARRLGRNYIGTEHLLLGMIREGEGIGGGVLKSLGVSLEKARAEVVRILAPLAPEAADARKTGATLPGESPSIGRSVFLAHSFDNAGKLVADVLREFLGLLGFRVVTGEAYSPRGVSSKIKERIREQAIAVCILTRKRGAGADPRRTSQWVLDEATVAEALDKPVFLLIEKGVEAEIGIHGDKEYIPFTMRSLQTAMIKLLQGLRELGYEFAPKD